MDEFLGNSGGQKYNRIVADPRNKKVFDIDPHFRQISKICFSQAMIVIDRYYDIRQAAWAMERVQKNEFQEVMRAKSSEVPWRNGFIEVAATRQRS